jgi:hypothetical protein
MDLVLFNDMFFLKLKRNEIDPYREGNISKLYANRKRIAKELTQI